ncbi:bifunctional diguanylate cyclase/phosphodiesterase [Vibrio sp. ZSDZ34]|uniref:Bifunctional diguanylate cyclase/phosphodiesterase n=1 Tax=Vibrio gelatinilyticus TaxID=2893468 RepID=A0A9X2AVJ7_9VIBR|nr:bifunctional diguanylate cyclase/phosphodiesterase [Vibrio gelatinilyticus]MCJ2376256.1 bifunctional diguanylate cyclase/phosphodiesterase [Vibrio gelatinilyticus]
MSLIKRLYSTLLPLTLFLFIVAGIGVYHVQFKYFRTLQLEKWCEKVATALEANVFEQQAISAILYETAGSAQFGRYIQSASSSSSQAFLQKYANDLIRTPRVNELGDLNLYVLDPEFNLTISTFNRDPFEDLTIPDEVYSLAYGTFITMKSGNEFLHTDRSYVADNNTFRFTHIMAFTPHFLPSDRRANTSDSRFILIVDGPLNQLTQLLKLPLSTHGLLLDIEQYTDSLREINETDNGPHIFDQTTTSATYETDNMSVFIELLPEYFDNVRRKFLWTTVVYMFLSCTSILALIYFVVNFQILKPIKILVRDINEGGLNLSFFKKSKGNGEVDILKNSYIESLAKIKYQAEFDSLTGLANRNSFFKFVSTRSEMLVDKELYIVCWDIVKFRKVNNLYGSQVADRLLIEASSLIREAVFNHQYHLGLGCSDYSIARIGGNQFAALIESDGKQPILDSVRNINQLLKSDIAFSTYQFTLNFAISIFPMLNNLGETLWYKATEEALKVAKTSSERFSLCIFDDASVERLERNDEVREAVKVCCENDDFTLAYMPIFDPVTLRVEGVEVLLRSSFLSKIGAGPDEFIPIAEQAGLITKIDHWVLSTALDKFQILVEKYDYKGTISVNISALELYNQDFIKSVGSIIRDREVEPGRVIIELTETSYVESSKNTVSIIRQLREMGFKVSLDDFGTGYTAFNQLLHYPVDELKIDKSFIDKIMEDSAYEHMVKMMIDLAHSSEIKVVAEGVEEQRQREILLILSVDLVQGYLMSKPLDFSDFLKIIKKAK